LVRFIIRGSLGLGGLLYLHIAEFIGVEDFAALQAFHVLGILFARHNAHTGVFTNGWHGINGF
jgi:hypothetical protein